MKSNRQDLEDISVQDSQYQNLPKLNPSSPVFGTSPPLSSGLASNKSVSYETKFTKSTSTPDLLKDKMNGRTPVRKKSSHEPHERTELRKKERRDIPLRSPRSEAFDEVVRQSRSSTLMVSREFLHGKISTECDSNIFRVCAVMDSEQKGEIEGVPFLSFQKGDVIEVHSQIKNQVWKGKLGVRVGAFDYNKVLVSFLFMCYTLIIFSLLLKGEAAQQRGIWRKIRSSPQALLVSRLRVPSFSRSFHPIRFSEAQNGTIPMHLSPLRPLPSFQKVEHISNLYMKRDQSVPLLQVLLACETGTVQNLSHICGPKSIFGIFLLQHAKRVWRSFFSPHIHRLCLSAFDIAKDVNFLQFPLLIYFTFFFRQRIFLTERRSWPSMAA